MTATSPDTAVPAVAAPVFIPAQRRPATPAPAPAPAERRIIQPRRPNAAAVEARRRQAERRAYALTVAAEGAYEMWRDVATAQVAQRAARAAENPHEQPPTPNPPQWPTPTPVREEKDNDR